mmetsp:Transcript_14575/g.23865  ORF Transcript_14575/g.23865 Transcript_14575/m.23865 type:complete len:92 (+) Transcript_14575:522-797(+)
MCFTISITRLLVVALPNIMGEGNKVAGDFSSRTLAVSTRTPEVIDFPLRFLFKLISSAYMDGIVVYIQGKVGFLDESFDIACNPRLEANDT